MLRRASILSLALVPRRRFVLALAALPVLLIAGFGPEAVAALTVTTQTPGDIDVSRHHTFAWRDGTPAADRRVEQHIRAAVEARLTARGYAKVAGDKTAGDNADLYIVTHAGKDPMFFFGILEVGVYDAASGDLLFSARATDVAPDSLKKAKKTIGKVLRQIFKAIPRHPGV